MTPADVTLNRSDDTERVIAMAPLILVAGVGMTAYGFTEYQSSQETLDSAVAVGATFVESDVRAVRGGSSGNRSRDDR